MLLRTLGGLKLEPLGEREFFAGHGPSGDDQALGMQAGQALMSRQPPLAYGLLIDAFAIMVLKECCYSATPAAA
jgi:hypothetical protein